MEMGVEEWREEERGEVELRKNLILRSTAEGVLGVHRLGGR